MKNTKSINGSELKEFRKNQGWSQKELAEMLNVSQGTVSCYECGKSHTPRKFSVAELEELCKTIATELVRRKSRISKEKVKVVQDVKIVYSENKSVKEVEQLLLDKIHENLVKNNNDAVYMLCDAYKCFKCK